MRINKTLAGLGAAAVIGVSGLALSASPAFASSFGCDAQVGCATLHSTQPSYPAGYTGSHVIAMDAKKQNPAGIVIGYPDLAQDKATSFDKVAHTYHSGVLAGDTFYTFVYAPTGYWSNQCVTADLATGELSLVTCTLGHNPYQQFVAGQVTAGTTIQWPVAIANFPGNREFILANMGGVNLNTNQTVAQAFNNANLLEDIAHVNPLVAVPNGASDARQLDTNGGVVTGNSTMISSPAPGFGQHSSYKITNVGTDPNEQWIWHT